VCQSTNIGSSYVRQTERLDCRARIQDTVHGPLHASIAPKIRLISCSVGKWSAQLCFRVPQVSVLVLCHVLFIDVPRFVVLVSDRDIAHKVFKSPVFAKPCIGYEAPGTKDMLSFKAGVLEMAHVRHSRLNFERQH
jgi:hypothetical protein